MYFHAVTSITHALGSLGKDVHSVLLCSGCAAILNSSERSGFMSNVVQNSLLPGIILGISVPNKDQTDETLCLQSGVQRDFVP